MKIARARISYILEGRIKNRRVGFLDNSKFLKTTDLTDQQIMLLMKISVAKSQFLMEVEESVKKTVYQIVNNLLC